MSFDYQKENSLAKRREEAIKIRKAYPDCFPVIIEKNLRSNLASTCNKKFLINGNLRVYHLNLLVRKRINLNKAEALYLFVNGKDLLKTDTIISEIYSKYANEDGFIYISYSEYTSFGK